MPAKPRRTRVNSRMMLPTQQPSSATTLFRLLVPSPRTTRTALRAHGTKQLEARRRLSEDLLALRYVPSLLFSLYLSPLLLPQSDFFHVYGCADVFDNRTSSVQASNKMPRAKAKRPKVSSTTSVPALQTVSLELLAELLLVLPVIGTPS